MQNKIKTMIERKNKKTVDFMAENMIENRRNTEKGHRSLRSKAGTPVDTTQTAEHRDGVCRLRGRRVFSQVSIRGRLSELQSIFSTD